MTGIKKTFVVEEAIKAFVEKVFKDDRNQTKKL